MKVHLATAIGTKASLRIYWGNDCPERSYHNAKQFLKVSGKLNHHTLGGEVEDHRAGNWPTKCDHCGMAVPAHGAALQVFTQTLYDTPSGELEPSSMWWRKDLPEDFYWSNHTGPHLHVKVPTGETWNIDSRAKNCGSPDDKEHRCWIWHGEPPNITVDKNGLTCSAGGGSIETENYHGFLRNGIFTPA